MTRKYGFSHHMDQTWKHVPNLSNFLNTVPVCICVIVNNPRFLMCLFHLSTFFPQNHFIICTISCQLMISFSVFKFVNISILYILALVSHPHFLMGFDHLSSTALQNKTIIICRFPLIDIPVYFFEISKIMLKMVTVTI